MTSAGTGITHSEFNDSKTEPVHFLQMWISPNKNELKPAYYTKHFSDEEKKNKLRLVVAPNVSALINIDNKVLVLRCVYRVKTRLK